MVYKLCFVVVEWVGPKEGDRNVKIRLDEQRKKIHVEDRRSKPLRMIDLRTRDEQPAKRVTVWNAEDKEKNIISIRVDGEIDLVSFSFSVCRIAMQFWLIFAFKF